MNTLSGRLAHALRLRKKSPAELARATGKTESAVSQWLSGETKSMRSDSLMATCALLSCKAQWLASGKGDSGLVDADDLMAGRYSPNSVNNIISLKFFSKNETNDIELRIPQFNPRGSMGRLLLRDQPGVIQGWTVNHEWVHKNIRSHSGAGNLCIVTGFGDSMKGMFNSGDPIVVDTGVTMVEYDAVYFFRVGEEGFIKRLQRIPGEGLRVLSENKQYDSWTIKPGMDFEVFGRVVKAWQGEDF